MNAPEPIRPWIIETSPELLYSIDEAARMMGCSRWSVERAMRSGEIAYIKAGSRRTHRVRISLAEIRAWQARHTIRRTTPPK